MGMVSTLEVALSDPLRAIWMNAEPRAAATADYLERHGIRVWAAAGVHEAAELVDRERAQVVFVSVSPKGGAASELCRELRERSDVPLVVVSAHDDSVDRVRSLEQGADDYVLRPVSAEELVARVRAILRRTRGAAPPERARICVGGLTVEPSAHRATLDGRDLALTGYELSLLSVFAERPGEVLSREELIERVRGSADESFDRSIDVHICHLRGKLGDDSRRQRVLRTVRGRGYQLIIPRTAARAPLRTAAAS